MSDNAILLSEQEIDAIGEILNISMGSAATAVSTLLNRQVIITTPTVVQQKFNNIDYAMLEPAMLVKIKYVQGISGANVMVFRQRDMRVILNLLMGNEDDVETEVVFDELTMSAACEVMNQMMGASATALSEFLGKTVNISTPEAMILDEENSFESAMEVDNEESIVSVSFNLDIEGVMSSDFISVLKLDLAKMLVSQVMGDIDESAESMPSAPAAPEPVQPPAPSPAAPAAPPAPVAPAAPAAAPAAPAQAAAPVAPAAVQGMPASPMPASPMPGAPIPGAAAPGMPGMPDAATQQQWGMPAPYGQMPYYPYPPYPQMPYGYPQQPASPGVIKQGASVQPAQFPNFSEQTQLFGGGTQGGGSNLGLIMNVPLNVSVEIGKTRRKIKEIMDFSQGTVIELEKQAGAPVDIVVNGQLIARGDVVVIDDNFGVRVTEIVGTKELIDSLENS